MSLQKWSAAVLSVVAAVGAVLSFDSLHTAAVPTFGDPLAYGFPLLTDALILGASLQFIAGARKGQPQAGWRLTAHLGVAGTVTLNALAAPSLGAVPWHITAPVVWSVLVELTARTVLGEWRAEHKPPLDRVPFRLWVTAPVESARTWLRLARRVEGEQAAARLEVGAYAAAVEALRLTLPGRGGRRARSILQRQLRAGSLVPEAVLSACGWLDPAEAADPAQRVLRAALGAALGRVPDVVDDQGDGEDETRRPGADSVRVEVVAVEPVSAPETVPEPRPAPVAAAESERAHRVTVRAVGDIGGGRSSDALRPRVEDAIRRRLLDPEPSAESIRRYLGCAPKTARELRDLIRESA